LLARAPEWIPIGPLDRGSLRSSTVIANRSKIFSSRLPSQEIETAKASRTRHGHARGSTRHLAQDRQKAISVRVRPLRDEPVSCLG